MAGKRHCQFGMCVCGFSFLFFLCVVFIANRVVVEDESVNVALEGNVGQRLADVAHAGPRDRRVC